MARLAFLTLIFISLFVATTNANPLLSSQQPVTNQAGDVHIAQSWSWADCGSPNDAIQIESISVSPDPPKPGQNLTVTVLASAQEKIDEGAWADVTVKLGLVKLLQKQYDLCEEARKADVDVQCPVKEGRYEVEQTVALPKEIPQAKFTIDARGYTVDDEDLFCVVLKVNFMKRPFPLGWW